MGKDLDCTEDVEDVELRLAGTHVHRVISCSIPVNANIKCCVRRKQQTCGNGFPALELFLQSKIALHLSVLLYLLLLLMLDKHTYL